jgi:hypothetical protein
LPLIGVAIGGAEPSEKSKRPAQQPGVLIFNVESVRHYAPD